MNSSTFSAHAEDGIRFFGTTTASVSHEIKNCLAIINESAGLLQDLVLLSQKGKPLDPERVNRVASQIIGQIQRADAIVKNLNSFAHSTDVPEKTVDIVEILTLVMALAQRPASNQGVALDFIPPQGTVLMQTNPFFFMHAVRQSLDWAMQAVGPEKTVEVTVQVADNTIGISFGKLENLNNSNENQSFYEQGEDMLEKLGGHLSADASRKEIRLVFDTKRQK